jgi:hypothetical protein
MTTKRQRDDPTSWQHSPNEARALFHSDGTTELACERRDGDGQQLARGGPWMCGFWLPLCHGNRLVHTHRAIEVVDAVGGARRWRRPSEILWGFWNNKSRMREKATKKR